MTPEERDRLKILVDQALRVLREEGEDYIVHLRLVGSRETVVTVPRAVRLEPEADKPALDDELVAVARLTTREQEVLDLIGEGLTDREIGARLLIGESTVKTYVKRTLRKLGARSRAVSLAHLQDREPHDQR